MVEATVLILEYTALDNVQDLDLLVVLVHYDAVPVCDDVLASKHPVLVRESRIMLVCTCRMVESDNMQNGV